MSEIDPGHTRSAVSKVRVYELAKELGVESKVVLTKLQELGEFVRSASSTIEAPVARRLVEAMGGTVAAKPVKKAAKKAAAPKVAAPVVEQPPVAETPQPATPQAPVSANPGTGQVAPRPPAARGSGLARVLNVSGSTF